MCAPGIAAPQTTAVDLFPTVNGGVQDAAYGIGTFGQPVPAGVGLDGSGAVYAGNLLGTALDYAGMTFTFAPPYVLTAYANVALPMGQDSSLTFLAVAVHENQPNQLFTVNYTDGSSTSFTQGVSNINTPQNYAGESIATTMAYRLNADGSEHAGAYNVYAYTFTLDPAKSVKSLTLPKNTDVFILALDVTSSGGPQIDSVELFPPNNPVSYAEYGIGTFGQPIPVNSGLDGSGAVYAENLLGTALDYGGMTFTFDPPNVLEAYAESVPLPATQDTSLTFLGAAARANQPNQIFTVNYTDGSSTNFTQGISNINTPQNYPGESIATTMPYRLNADGSEHAGAYNVYAYTLALDPTKNVKSLTLPKNPAVFVLAVDVTENAGPQIGAVDLFPSGYGEYGIGAFGQPVPGGRGLDGGGAVYAGNLLGTALNYGGMTFNFDPPFVLPTYGSVALPAGQDSALTFLAAAVHANQPDQIFTVNYTDGSSTSFTQSISNINTPQNYAGEAIAKTMPYRLNGDGTEHAGAYNVYAYTFELDSSKSVKSLTLPNNADVFVLAADVVTGSATSADVRRRK